MMHPAFMPEIKPTRRPRLTSKFHWRNSGQYFLRGILVLAPMLITFSALFWGFNKVDGVLRPFVTRPGLGFGSVLLFILLVGWISTFYFIKRVSRHLGSAIEHTPGVGFIYTSVRDFFEAFVGHKRRFNHAVLIDVLADDVWVVGFLTDVDPSSFNLGTTHVSVYVPQAYNVGGQLYLLKRDRVRTIENLAPADVMKYAVTGGAVELVEIDS
jgi:uncharacterized membrane protein